MSSLGGVFGGLGTSTTAEAKEYFSNINVKSSGGFTHLWKGEEV